MNMNYLVYFLLVLSIVLIFLEFYKFRKLNFIVNLLILYFFVEVFFKSNFWHLIFLSNELWRNVIIFLVVVSFIIILNLIKDYRFEVLCLNLMVLIGSLMIITCDNLLIVYLGLELQTFSLFILISKNKASIRSSESALKYFILGALSSGLFLLGMSLMFSIGLSLDLKNLVVNFSFNLNVMEISTFLISIAMFFKLAMFPLHFWVADIYEGSSWEVVSLISTIPKISVLSVILQLLSFSSFFIIFSILSIIIGTIGSLNQTKLKRLLAYSGVSHMGFVLLSLGLLTNQGLESGFVYLLIYIITLFGVFILIVNTNLTKGYFIVELGGLNIVNKVIAVSWLILFLSIAGIPPLSGFLSKWLILISVLDYNYIIPVIVAILFSAIGVAYYLRVVKIVYFQKNSSYLNWQHILKPKRFFISSSYYILGVIIYFTLTLLVHPTAIFSPFYMGFNYFF